ncbi:helix-turn-helix transcriptional regulator [Dictyobacter formicarum]|uniref:Helix-turn-helix transcriptional regulator n=1 Tax=Dictyobacter formicarum TaxID=2778368 RepID=A0ABQ3VIQ6_9CHLR|nr:LuxR C-terminal-related transcriptional regulator [Dictyobacter formicarum]GHO85361.1 helix-turn-helix transcriptional regulator [Dictyobacter formicarum]
MVRDTLHLLRWITQTQRYTLTLGTQTLPSEITSGDEVWTQWLATVSSFAFESRSGIHCTIRKERLQRGDAYWYAYRSVSGRTKKRYLGRSADLSFARLEEVSTLFANEGQHTRQSLLEAQDSEPAVRQAAPPTQSEDLDIPYATTTAQHAEKGIRKLPAPSALPLLETKLHPPLLPAKLVKRTRLLEQLDTSLTRKLTILQAPAGSGKTTLVNQWLSTRFPKAKNGASTEPVLAWLSLDAGDNDPLRFWRYLMTAWLKLLAPKQVASGQAALALLSALHPSPFESPALELALTQLLNALARSPFEGLLVLDDYHVISDSRIHEPLAFLIDYLPATIHVLLLSRSEPPLPLLRWRARGEVYELQTADLRFSLQETAAFFQQALPLDLSSTALSRLDSKLEGWAAGLRLLSLTLSQWQTPQAIEQALLSLGAPNDPADRSLLDYFISEILEAQSEPMQRFLLQTSVLGRLCAPLCAAVTRNEKSADLLEAIARAGLFLEALKGPGGWYRYHALFAAAMRQEAGRRLGEEVLRKLSSQASAWYEQEALLTEAIEAASLARDVERVVRLIERVHEQNFDSPQTMLQWLEQLPEAVLREHPTLCFLFATELRFPVKLWFATEAAVAAEAASIPSAERVRIETLLSMAEEGWRRRGEVSWIGAIWAHRALSALLDEEPFSSVVHFARQALIFLPRKGALDPRVQMYRSSCLLFVGQEKLDLGQVDEAREMLLQAKADNLPPGNRFLAVDILLTLGKIYLAQGEFSLAQKYLLQALSDARELHDEKVIVEAQLELTMLEEKAETRWQVSPLSAQEERVLQGLSAGLSNQEIANELIISINTVKYHVKHLYQKLGVSNRLQASEAARQLRLSSPAPRLPADSQRNEPH